MAYTYAKNQKEIRKKLSRRGYVIKMIGKTNKRFDLEGKHKYFYTARRKLK